MAIRFPLVTVIDYNDTPQTGAGSVAGGVAKTFTIPQDADNVVVKLTASVIGGGVSATFQTTDDGGTTWYDVQRTSIVSNANTTTAEWLSIPVATLGQRSNNSIGSVVATGSVIATGAVGATIGNAAASTLASKEVSGMPILSQFGRVFLRYTAAVTSTDLARVQVKVNSQSATA
jgi:hypothetical protein